jgi:methionyl-tRNA formyltransferase
MKVLFLGYADSPLIEFLGNHGEEVVQADAKITYEFVKAENFDFLISYGYRHIIMKRVLSLFPDKAINLHISYLPWNRGADPNFWSHIDDTPKGVTIHFLDEGLDTGDILLQEKVEFDKNDTLETSYQKLHKTIQLLFIENWDRIKNGKIRGVKQDPLSGSVHKAKDKEKIFHMLKDGWSTKLELLKGMDLIK